MAFFEIVEEFVQGKTGQGDDLIVKAPFFTAAIDGVSGPEGEAAALCVKAVCENLDAQATERDFAAQVCAEMTKRFGEPQANMRMAGATAVVLSHTRQQGWIYGDAALVLLGEGLFEVHSCRDGWEDAVDATRALLNKLMLISGELPNEDTLYEQDPGRDMMGPIRARQHSLANREGGYSVLCAKPVPETMARVVQIPPMAKMLVLVTDGYPIDLMNASDFTSLAAIESKLADVNALDPHCMRINLGPKGIMRDPATGILQASYDDRTYVRLVRQG